MSLAQLSDKLLLRVLTQPCLTAIDLARVECTSTRMCEKRGDLVQGGRASITECAAEAVLLSNAETAPRITAGSRRQNESWKFVLDVEQRWLAKPMPVAAGPVHTMVTAAGDGLGGTSLYTFGDGRLGQLGHDIPGVQADALGLHDRHALALLDLDSVSENSPRQLCLYDAGGTKLQQVVAAAAGATMSHSHAWDQPCAGTCGPSSAHSAAVTSEGHVYTWGSAGKGVLGHLSLREGEGEGALPPSPPIDDSLVCTPRRLLGFPPRTRIILIAAGDAHTACVSSLGELFTWGFGGHHSIYSEPDGRLGHGASSQMTALDNGGVGQITPRRVETLSAWRIVAVSCGGASTAAVVAGGKLFMCGRLPPVRGQEVELPNEEVIFVGSTYAGGRWRQRWRDVLVPQEVPALSGIPIKSVSCGSCDWHGTGHFAAVSLDGTLYTWGGILYGRLGHGESAISVPEPQPVKLWLQPAPPPPSQPQTPQRRRQPARGALRRVQPPSHPHTAADDDDDGGGGGGGDDHDDELPSGTSKSRDAKRGRKRGKDSRAEAGGGGGGAGAGSCVALPLPAGEVVEVVSCGQDHTAAITNRGRLFTWGRGTFGALGHGRVNAAAAVGGGGAGADCAGQDQYIPRLVQWTPPHWTPPLQVTAVSCGWTHTAVALASGELATFGQGYFGQLGLGESSSNEHEERMLPRIVSDLPPLLGADDRSSME